MLQKTNTKKRNEQDEYDVLKKRNVAKEIYKRMARRSAMRWWHKTTDDQGTVGAVGHGL